MGRCRGCGHRVQGRHALQTSDALGAADERVVPDETGWRVGGLPAWLHAFATADAVAYHIDRHRGFDAAAGVLGAGYAGVMTHDGWPPYLKFKDALHQLPNERFARHLWNNRVHLFTFLRHKGVDATNWRAEQAIRPAVVDRKVSGGNRTDAGAAAQSALMSVLQTAKLRGRAGRCQRQPG